MANKEVDRQVKILQITIELLRVLYPEKVAQAEAIAKTFNSN